MHFPEFGCRCPQTITGAWRRESNPRWHSESLTAARRASPIRHPGCLFRRAALLMRHTRQAAESTGECPSRRLLFATPYTPP